MFFFLLFHYIYFSFYFLLLLPLYFLSTVSVSAYSNFALNFLTTSYRHFLTLLPLTTFTLYLSSFTTFSLYCLSLYFFIILSFSTFFLYFLSLLFSQYIQSLLSHTILSLWFFPLLTTLSLFTFSRYFLIYFLPLLTIFSL